MTIHKVGYSIIGYVFILLFGLNILVWHFCYNIPVIFYIILPASFIFFLLVVSFFRKPKREMLSNDKHVYAPADGTVVVIEEMMETEYFKEKRIQVSVFMSPLNVHINWFPVSGLISYFKYHPGKHLCAWSPKASTDNERTTIVIKRSDNTEIMIKQIAGAMARRIVTFIKGDENVQQNTEVGFIKFGSRVDILLPLHAKINVELEQKVTGSQTIIAEF